MRCLDSKRLVFAIVSQFSSLNNRINKNQTWKRELQPMALDFIVKQSCITGEAALEWSTKLHPNALNQATHIQIYFNRRWSHRHRIKTFLLIASCVRVFFLRPTRHNAINTIWLLFNYTKNSHTTSCIQQSIMILRTFKASLCSKNASRVLTAATNYRLFKLNLFIVFFSPCLLL